MTVALLSFVLGLVMLAAGAELVVRAGSRLAAAAGVPPLIVGMTLVAVGTSIPELAIGIDAALQGDASIGVANIAGTNSVNILLILGISALIAPLRVESVTIRRTLPLAIIAGSMFFAMSWDGQFGRVEGALLVAGALAYTAAAIRWSRLESRAVEAEFEEAFGPDVDITRRHPPVRDLLLVISGIAVVTAGSDLLVDSAAEIALEIGVSEAFIGLTIVAIGTSAPELATMLVSTLRGERDIAIGNLIGSSVYNILAILGITALVANRVTFSGELVRVDIPVMLAATVAVTLIAFSGRRITRAEGAGLVASYLVYLSYLIAVRT